MTPIHPPVHCRRPLPCSLAAWLLVALAPAAPYAQAAETLAPVSLTVEAAHRRALDRNPQWLAASERLLAAAARVRQAEAGFKPQVSTRSAFFVVSRPPFVQVPPVRVPGAANPIFPGDNLELGENVNARLEINLDWLLLGGPVRSNVERARLVLEAGRLRNERFRQQLLFGVEEAFLQAASAAEAVQVAKETLAARRAHQQVALARFETGLSPRFDVVRAETDIAAAEEQLERHGTALDLAYGRLALMVGDSLAQQYRLSLPALPVEPPPLDDLIARSIAARADLAALEEERKAAVASVRAARSERKPTVGVRVQGQVNEPQLTVDPSGVRLLLLGSWSLHDGGRSRSLEDEAAAQVRALELEREHRRRASELEIRSAYLSLRNARGRIRTAERQVAQAEEAREIARTRYDVGTGLAVEIADSEATLAEARVSLVRARLDASLAAAQLRLAVGLPEVVPSGS